MEETSLTEMGKFIESRLRELGVNNAEFAKRVGVSRGAVSNWLYRTLPKARLIPAITRALHLELDEVVIIFTRCGGSWDQNISITERVLTEGVLRKIHTYVECFGPITTEKFFELWDLADKS